MVKQKAGCLILIICLTLSVPGINFAGSKSEKDPKHTIKWYRADFPPVTIPDGPDADLGFFDKVTQLLIDQLPEYEHIRYTANFKRIITELKGKDTACCPSLYKTRDRESFIEFSIPAFVVLPNVIITRKDNTKKFEPYLDQDNKLSLSNLLKNPDIRLGISNGRKYSGGIDEIINQSKSSDHILVRAGQDVLKGLLNMLLLGRIDCTMGYPIEVKYVLKNKAEFDKLQIYFIAENEIPYTIGHVGCPKNQWGEEVIATVNQILKAHRQSPEYLNFYKYWLDDETALLYEKIAHTYFETEKTNTPSQ